MTTLPRLRHQNASRPLPPIPDIQAVRAMSGSGVLDHEPLVRVIGVPGVIALHAYRNAGYVDAVDDPWLRLGARMALARAVRLLPPGYGLGVWDAWRPLALQQTLADEHAHLPDGYVCHPSADPSTPPPHLTGGTIDVTLTRDGEPLSLGTEFDEFTSDAAAAAWEDRDDAIRDHRRVLFWAMRESGFVPYPLEWWHFEIGTLRCAHLHNSAPWYGPASPPS